MRTIVFDLGGVLASPESFEQVMTSALGVHDPEAVKAAIWRDRLNYDAGADDLKYWQKVGKDLGLEVTAEKARELTELDGRLWTNIRSTARAVLDRVHAAGVPMAILSNAPRSMAHAMRDADWAPLMSEIFVSGEMGLYKPQREIYDQVTARLGVEPEQISFIDDKPINVFAAKSAGLDAHQWISDADTQSWLESLGVL